MTDARHVERPVEIRRVTADDLALMDGILNLFAEVFEMPDHYSSARPSPAYLRRLLGGPMFVALAAVVDDRVIGALAAYELPKFEQERSELYIYDLAVHGDFRRRGIATALIRELGRIGAARGAWVMYVQADTGVEDEAAIALYSKLGRREEVLHFDIPVE